MTKCLRLLHLVGFEPTPGRLPDPTLITLSTMPRLAPSEDPIQADLRRPGCLEKVLTPEFMTVFTTTTIHEDIDRYSLLIT
ncbi:hypothetical protein E2C01_055492 [Portunus trituberculatus]|uniref:Uncharacterized protein n=1 Tax=Portunus trituberculatus TaxID=210409 RepID=A0A5B7GMK9_PORTR|nr:hypothetical protein [Portunus trituberculatus]